MAEAGQAQHDGESGQQQPRQSAVRALGARLRQRGKSNGMRYNPFNLFTCALKGIETPFADDTQKIFNDVEYTHAATGCSVRMLERREAAGTTPGDIATAHADGIDNTGNFHWPAEEILAHALLLENAATLSSQKNEQRASRGRCVLELGAGVGLAGLALWRADPTARVVLTDGNSGVVRVLRHNVAAVLGKQSASLEEQPQPDAVSLADFDECRLHAAQLLWHRADEAFAAMPWLFDEVDEVVAADCLFFDAFHDALKALLLRFLRRTSRPPPTVTIYAPQRGTTAERFIAMMQAEDDVTVTVSEDYDADVLETHERLVASQHPEYVPERHFPRRIVFASKSGSSSSAVPDASTA